MAQQIVLESVIRANLDAKGFEQGSRKIIDVSKQLEDSAQKIIVSQQRLVQSSAQSGRAIETLQSQLDKAYAAQVKYQRAVETINAAFERGRISEERKAQLLELARSRYLSVSQSIERTGVSVTNLNRSFTGLASNLRSVSLSLAALLPQFSTFAAFGGAGAVVGVLASAVKEAEEAERLMLRTQAVLRATGFTAGLTAEQIREMSERIASETLASTRGVEQAAQKLLTFRTIEPEFFERALRAAQDLAAVGFGSIETAAVQLGKALEDPERGLTALRRSGISFTEAQQEVIRSLVETGRAAEAQRIILEQIERQVGGAGRAEAGGLAGAFDTLSQNVENFLERIGNLGPLQAATAAVSALANAVAFLDRQVARVSGGGTPQESAEIAVQRAQERVAEIQARLERGGRASPRGVSNERIRANLRAQLAEAERELVSAEARLRAIIEEGERQRAEAAARGAEERARIERENAENAISVLRREVDKRVAIEEQFQQRMRQIERARRAGVPEEQLQPLIRQIEKAREDALKALEERPRREQRSRVDELKEQIALLEIVGEKERFVAQEVQRAKAGERAEVERLAGVLFDLQKKREEEQELAKQAAQLYDQTRTPYERYIKTLEDLARTYDALVAKLGSGEADEVIRRASEAALKTLQEAEQTTKKTDDFAKSLGLTFESAFENAIVRGEKFSKVLRGIETDLLRLGTRKLITEPLMNLFGSFTKGLFGEGGISGIFSSLGSGIASFFGSLFHQGGIVGETKTPIRLVDPSIFAQAPRLHKGLMPGEFPAILQRGEIVLPKELSAALQTGMGRPINVTVNVSGGVEKFQMSRGQIAAEMAREIQRATRNL